MTHEDENEDKAYEALLAASKPLSPAAAAMLLDRWCSKQLRASESDVALWVERVDELIDRVFAKCRVLGYVPYETEDQEEEETPF